MAQVVLEDLHHQVEKVSREALMALVALVVRVDLGVLAVQGGLVDQMFQKFQVNLVSLKVQVDQMAQEVLVVLADLAVPKAQVVQKVLAVREDQGDLVGL